MAKKKASRKVKEESSPQEVETWSTAGWWKLDELGCLPTGAVDKDGSFQPGPEIIVPGSFTGSAGGRHPLSRRAVCDEEKRASAIALDVIRGEDDIVLEPTPSKRRDREVDELPTLWGVPGQRFMEPAIRRSYGVVDCLCALLTRFLADRHHPTTGFIAQNAVEPRPAADNVARVVSRTWEVFGTRFEDLHRLTLVGQLVAMQAVVADRLAQVVTGFGGHSELISCRAWILQRVPVVDLDPRHVDELRMVLAELLSVDPSTVEQRRLHVVVLSKEQLRVLMAWKGQENRGFKVEELAELSLADDVLPKGPTVARHLRAIEGKGLLDRDRGRFRLTSLGRKALGASEPGDAH